MSLRIGTRDSLLARWQAEWVASQLQNLGVDVHLIPISTHGDRQQGSIGSLGADGVFTKEIQRELLAGRIDLAVHSLKDLTTTQPPGLRLAAVPKRAPAGDVLVSPRGTPLEELPAGAVVGTGSARRRAQLLRVRPDLQVKDVRGNVETRLRKLAEGQFDAVILAEAGLQRLSLADHITQRLPFSICLPAIGQGALGLEIRTDDSATGDQVVGLDHPDTHAAVLAERAMLAALQGGCLAPVAGFGRTENQRLTLTGRVIGHDGVRLLEAALTDSLDAALALGRQVAGALLAQGAAELIHAARHA